MTSKVSLPARGAIDGLGLAVFLKLTRSGPESPTADAAILFLGEEMTLQDGEAACADLGEQLWAPELDTGSIQRNLDFLLYQGKGDTGSWIAAYDDAPRGISSSGDVINGLDAAEKLPVLCTQTAPFSNSSVQDTDDRWRVSVRANNEVLTGYASIRALNVPM